MHINTESVHMKNRMFTSALARNILDDCKQELEGTPDEPYSLGYETSMKVLEAVLTVDQREMLQKATDLFLGSMEQLLQFYFARGVFTSFQQHFVRKPDSRLLVEEVLSASRGYQGNSRQTHQEKYREADSLLNALRSQVGSENRDTYLRFTQHGKSGKILFKGKPIILATVMAFRF